MGKRLSRITTRTGDDGTTGLGDGSRVTKDDLRIAVLGDIDELNSQLGVLLTEPLPLPIDTHLHAVQHALFDLGAELCMPGHTVLDTSHLLQLDHWIAEYNATLPPLAEFILPGGVRPAALAHVCRTVCRRAERSLVALNRNAAAAANPVALQYLNRLSDLLFVLARVLNRQLHEGGTTAEVLWRNPHMNQEDDSE